MKTKVVFGGMLTVLLVGLAVLCSFTTRVEGQLEMWVPFVPESAQVRLDYRKQSGISYIDVSIDFPSSAFNVTDWGAPTHVGNDISADAKVWHWTGVSLPLTMTMSYSYDLGNLPTGQYFFTFKAWGETVKGTTFIVRITVPADYLTIQDAINHADPGDTVFVKTGTYYEHVIINKTVSLIGEKRETTFIDGNGTGTVVYVFANNVTVSGFTISNGGKTVDWDSSIQLHMSSNSTIVDNAIIGSQLGIAVIYSPKPKVIGNEVYEAQNIGVYVLFSEGAAVKENSVHNTTIGIDIDSSHASVVEFNAIQNCTDMGIEVYGSSSCLVARNNSSRNGVGVRVQSFAPAYCSDQNSVIENILCQNNLGMQLYGTDLPPLNNTMIHNNFIDNRQQVDPGANCRSYFDNGWEGNYWSDYNGTDTDGDGVGDTFLPWQGVDHYPLMNRYWNPSDVNHDLRVDIKDLAYAAKAYGSHPAHPNWNPRVDLNSDNRIDIKDLVLIAKNYGKAYM